LNCPPLFDWLPSLEAPDAAVAAPLVAAAEVVVDPLAVAPRPKVTAAAEGAEVAVDPLAAAVVAVAPLATEPADVDCFGSALCPHDDPPPNMLLPPAVAAVAAVAAVVVEVVEPEDAFSFLPSSAVLPPPPHENPLFVVAASADLVALDGVENTFAVEAEVVAASALLLLSVFFSAEDPQEKSRLRVRHVAVSAGPPRAGGGRAVRLVLLLSHCAMHLAVFLWLRLAVLLSHSFRVRLCVTAAGGNDRN